MYGQELPDEMQNPQASHKLKFASKVNCQFPFLLSALCFGFCPCVHWEDGHQPWRCLAEPLHQSLCSLLCLTHIPALCQADILTLVFSVLQGTFDQCSPNPTTSYLCSFTEHCSYSLQVCSIFKCAIFLLAVICLYSLTIEIEMHMTFCLNSLLIFTKNHGSVLLFSLPI